MNLNFVNELSKTNLLVAGEVGIDEYLWGDTRRISPEAPVPVVEVDSQTFKLGLAANVAQNIASLGGKLTLVTVCGDDEDSFRLKKMVEEARLRDSIFIRDSSRPTLRKVRVIAQKQHVVRIDFERQHPLDATLARSFTESLCDQIPNSDGVILQDYGKGVWSPDTMAFVRHARAHGKPVFVDPSRNSPLALYRGTTLLTPNIVEAEILTGTPSLPSKRSSRDQNRLKIMAERMLVEADCQHAIITCGDAGMAVLNRGTGELQHIPTFAREVFDVTGAGDTVIAVLAMMYVQGHPIDLCMKVANAAAGIVVGQIGTASVTPDQLKGELERLHEIGLI